MSDELSGLSLLELFRAEAEGHLAALTDGLLALERTGGEPSTIEPLMRAAHSLKGAARVVGLQDAERLAHVLENVFVQAQKGAVRLRPDQVDALLSAVDRLDRAARGEPPADDLAPLLDRLERIASATDPAPAPAAEPAPAPASKPPRGRSRKKPAASSAPPVLPEEPRSPPAPKTPASAPASPNESRVVRVAADTMNRLLGLAGASLVEARQLRPLVDTLHDLKTRQAELRDTIQAIAELHAAGAVEPARLHALAESARREADHVLGLILARIERMEGHARRSEDISERLHHEVLSSRLRPLSDGVRGFPRLVRDVARQLGKQVRFEIQGEGTGVDRDILEKLEAPLNHLIRNALDHGIEPPEERSRAGKDATATIRLEARHLAGMLQVVLTDDGRGIDVDRVRSCVVERGLSTPEMTVEMNEAEVLAFLFLPGFSTRDQVTELSGRGVGLDVVQSMVQAVGGGVRLATTPGGGTCFTLLLPITMSVVRALLVEIGGEPYAFPLSRLDRIEAVATEAVEMIEGRAFFRMGDAVVGLVAAAEILERPPAGTPPERLPVVVVSDRGHRFGIVVERFICERDLDVRPLDPRLGKVPNVNSASVLEDGTPVLILDVEDLVRSVDNLLGGRRLKGRPGAAGAATRATARRVLVVDDSITVRELERQLLESRGYLVDVAVDGMDGWNAVRGGRYDLVVSDVDMPRMDGVELVRHIKSDERFRSLPVVIVSYKDRAEDRERGLDAGADCYLTKSSFHDETFLQTVEDLLGEAGV